MIKTRVWIIIFAAVIAVCSAAALLVYFTSGKDATYANVYVNGECVYSVDLSAVSEPKEIEINAEGGINIIRIEKDRICIIDADCGDKTCVRTGWITDGSAPIICLPHKLVIRIEKNGAEIFDAVSG